MGARVSELTYGMVPPDILLSYDGLAFLQAIIAGKVPQPPICKPMSFHLAEAEKGRVVFEGHPIRDLYNPIGSVHGGFAATLLDSCTGCAIFTTLTKGETWTTLDLKVNYVRAIGADTGPVRAEGRLIHRGRTISTSEGDIKDRSGKLYAHATTTCMIFPAKP
ncbi:MAG: PaaI family thioesterase [Pseudolabrys sp.]|nr:PaaI family thioesterase [Pseudolabrys sp.]